MKRIWRPLSSAEIKKYEEIDEDSFGTFAPTLLQSILIFIAQKSFFKRGQLRRLIAYLTYSIRKKPLDIYFRNCAFRLHYDRRNHIQDGLLVNPKYNFDDIEFLLKGSDENSNFVDIGANIGLYCQPLALNSPKGQVIAIDANPIMIKQLDFNVKASNLKNLKTIFSAVSDKTGSGSLSIRNDDSAIVAIDEKINDGIPIRTLKNILMKSKIGKIYGLKIDVEGHEDLALAPFLLSAKKKELPTKIVIEHSNYQDYPQCQEAFNKLNYSLIGRSKNNSFYELSSTNLNAKHQAFC
jgi:FkbM family methyltransferase|tara:strand:- start:122 stop:1006 length:885 start_codon:yes stop_codon:yes gene_type:complete